jgi:magnesium-transporting ATPase (P-type)
MVLDVCSKIEAKKGVKEISKKFIEKLERANAKMGSKGLRVLGLAYRIFSAEDLENYKEIEDMERDLTLLSLIGKFPF